MQKHTYTVKLSLPAYNDIHGSRTLIVTNAEGKTIRKNVPMKQEFCRIELWEGAYSYIVEDSDQNGSTITSEKYDFEVKAGVERMPTLAAIILQRNAFAPDPFETEPEQEQEIKTDNQTTDEKADINPELNIDNTTNDQLQSDIAKSQTTDENKTNAKNTKK